MTNYFCGFIFAFFILSLCFNTANANVLPFVPRLTISGGSGNSSSQGNIDTMIPLFGNNDSDVYADLSGQYGSDQTWFGSLGLGIRQAVNHQYLIGAYGFIDRDQTVDNRWLVFNPGIEVISNQWDGRINAYIPIGPDQRFQGQYFGNQIGLTNKEYFQNHSQYDGLYNKETVIGTGMDADIGYTFSSVKNLRVHGGGYYFIMPGTAQNIKGEEVGLDIPINKTVSLSLEDSNDNIQHHTAMLELKFAIGGISNRLMTPVHRHFATLYNSSSIPQSSSFLYTGRDHVLEKSHIWFFTQQGGENFNDSNNMNNCTYEHPCNSASFNQKNLNDIDHIDSGVNFYLNPGEYQLGERLELNNGQSIYGRTNDYKLAATSQSGLPMLMGGLDLYEGNNHLDSFELLNQNADQTQGISIQNADNISINHVIVGQMDADRGFLQPLVIEKSQQITLQNSVLNSFGNGSFVIDSQDVQDLNINNNIIHSNGSSGIDFVEHNSGIHIDHNVFNINNSETGISIEPGLEDATVSDFHIAHNLFNINHPYGSVFGITDYTGNSVVNLSHNVFNLSSHQMGVGMMIGGSGEAKILNADHNVFNLNVVGDSHAEAYGIFMYSGTVNAEHNAFNLHSTGRATGIQIYDSGLPAVVNIKDNIFDFNAPTVHHEENNGGIINDLGGNQWNNGL
jgi:hypothetical protein